MKRGDIISIADPTAGDFARKPRPALIVQTNAFLDDHASISVCLITSHLTGLALFRIPIAAGATTGLREDSEISVDKLQTVWRHRIGRLIGMASADIMTLVDDALRRWLSI